MAMSDLERTVVGKGRKFLLRVETSHEAEDYRKYEDIRNEIWGFPDDHLAGTRNMMCENFLAEGGSLFIGAFAGSEGGFRLDAAGLAGFCYGFVGVVDKEVGFRDPANLRFYSQFTGVRPEFRTCGLGVLMKEFQRDVVLRRFGIATMICTYDPLTGVNAARNVRHFGMEVLEYRVATYGEYGGLLNRSDVASDRFLMSWDLARPRRRPAYDLKAAQAAPATIRTAARRIAGRSGEIQLEVVEGTDPEAEAEALLVPIPLDFYRMLRETDVADPDVRRIPVDWRMATREVLRALFGRGFKVVDFRRAGGRLPASHYVLVRAVPQVR